MNILQDYYSQLFMLLLISIITFYIYIRYVFSYWERRGIQSVKGTFPFGCFRDFILLRLSASQLFCKLCEEAGDVKYFGYYSFLSPSLIVRDIELIKDILVKDFNNFTDHGVYYDEKRDICSAHLFALEGSKWKKIRSKITPSLSSSKVKLMFHAMKSCTLGLINYIEKILKTGEYVDFKVVNAKFILDVIANVALGIEENNMENDTDFCKMAFKVTEPNIVQAFRFIIGFLCRKVAALLKLRFTPKIVEKYFLSIVRQIIEFREKNNYRRDDFIQQLIDIRNDGDAKYNGKSDNSEGGESFTMTTEEITAQAFVFVVAGFETSSSGLTYCLFELAVNPDIQSKLREEIDDAFQDGDITYEKLNELVYLDMVINESLRKHPPLGFLQRECSKDYRLPDGRIIEAGTKIVIPVRQIQMNSKFFPNPHEFNPERFNKISPAHTVLPFTFMPFGEGPRICIGQRFSKIQTKLAVSYLLSRFKLEPYQNTKVAPKEEATTFILQPKNGMFIRVIKR